MISDQEKEEIKNFPDWMLLHNIKCDENIMANPDKFPKADKEYIRQHWIEMVAEAVGRALP